MWDVGCGGVSILAVPWDNLETRSRSQIAVDHSWLRVFESLLGDPKLY